jgi:hypothetical protein
MVESMPFESFSERYGFTESRQFLITLMEQEVRNIIREEGPLRCVVFGSMVNSPAPEPKDIDVIISLSSHKMPCEWLYPTDKWHAFPVRVIPPAAPAEPEVMITCFNDSERRLGDGVSIRLEDCIEVTFDSVERVP